MEEKKDNVINLEGKNEKELLKAFGEISEDALFLQKCLSAYDNKDEALKAYEEDKAKRKSLSIDKN